MASSVADSTARSIPVASATRLAPRALPPKSRAGSGRERRVRLAPSERVSAEARPSSIVLRVYARRRSRALPLLDQAAEGCRRAQGVRPRWHDHRDMEADSVGRKLRLRHAALAVPALVIAAVLAVLILGDESSRSAGLPFTGKPVEVGGLRLPARIHGDALQLATPKGFEDRFWAGVNLGSTIPGRQPGEVAARATDYHSWFEEMGQLGVRVVRVYTLLDPSFYSELAAYNRAHPDAPLYVIHGVWIPEERLAKSRDLWDPQVLREQRRLTDEVHAAVSGDFHAPTRL